MWGITIFSLGSPGANVLDSPVVTSSPSLVSMAFRMRNLISLNLSPDFCVAIFPVLRCCTVAWHASLLCCALIHAALLEKDVSGNMAAHLAAGSITVSAISLRNLCIEQFSDEQLAVCLL